MGSKKIDVGDWVIDPDGKIGQVSFRDGWRVTVGDNGWDAGACTKLPASPADMAKSHQLLMRWHRFWTSRSGSLVGLADLETKLAKHCRRLTTKQPRRGGKGEK